MGIEMPDCTGMQASDRAMARSGMRAAAGAAGGGRRAAMASQTPLHLPKVQTKKQLMDYLEDQIASPPGEDRGDSGRGGPRELGSYVIETNGRTVQHGEPSGTAWEIDGTGVDEIKILRVRRDGAPAVEFFADISDKRFFILHTCNSSRDAKAAVDGLVELRPPSFDRMWLPHVMLDAIAKEEGNTFQGFGVHFTGGFADDDGAHAPPLEDLNLTVNGTMARDIEGYLRDNDYLRDAIAYSKIRVIRGEARDARDYVHDDICDDGYFVVKRGKSIQDHVDLVRASKNRYARTVEAIERCRLGVYPIDGKWICQGEPLSFLFDKKIPDVQQFVHRLFDSDKPFQLWGIQSEVEAGYYSVAAVDLHTGDPLNFEIADNMMRVYLNKHGSGNTIMRLLRNLQARFGAGVRCRQVDEAVGD